MRPADLEALAEQLEFAEGNASPGLLPTPPIRHLASGGLPRAVVLGAKGAGKTFAWGQMVLAGSRVEFARLAGEDHADAAEARRFPLLAPTNMGQELARCVHDLEASVVRGGEGAMASFWTRAIAGRLALPAGAGDSVRSLDAAVSQQCGPLLLLVDGIEDALQTGPGAPISGEQSALLRGLLQDLPASLRDAGCEHLGLVVFVRRDLAADAIPQNFRQFEALHRNTLLEWSGEDVLRLPLWLLDRLGQPLAEAAEVTRMGYDDLRRTLVPFWGEKLGKGKEAHTDRWVLAALSDFSGRLQARDLIRLLRFAAKASDRLPLQPRALRGALAETARRKIEELEREIRGLKELFDKLRKLPSERQRIPSSGDELGLSGQDRAFLERHGLLIEDDGALYMPEIIRQGLGFGLARRGRARVVALYRGAARERV